MGGYTTQSRKTSEGLRLTVIAPNGSVAENNTDLSTIEPRNSQTTTSYRTSGTDTSDDDSPTNASSSLDFIKKLGDEKRSGPRSEGDTGHTFSTYKSEAHYSHPHVDTGQVPAKDVGRKGRWIGPLLVLENPSNFAETRFIDVPGVDEGYYGTKAIGLTAPTNSVADLGVALAELYREGLPKLVGSNLLHSHLLSIPAKLGEEYLNWQFGYKPLAHDMSDAMGIVSQASQIANQYLRDNGRIVRRKYSFGKTLTRNVVRSGGTNFLPLGATYSYCWADTGSTGQITITEQASYEVWFSGAYQYFIPLDSRRLKTLETYASLAQHATGLELTPEVMWNLAPWSWLSDWLVNVGDLVHNFSAFGTDGLVLKYGYLMVKKTSVKTYRHSGVVYPNGTQSGPITNTYTQEWKTRSRATPYGFGLNPNSFTNRQWSILGALGLTKGPTSLR